MLSSMHHLSQRALYWQKRKRRCERRKLRKSTVVRPKKKIGDLKNDYLCKHNILMFTLNFKKMENNHSLSIPAEVIAQVQDLVQQAKV